MGQFGVQPLGGPVGVTAGIAVDGMAAQDAVQVHVVSVKVLGDGRWGLDLPCQTDYHERVER